MLKVSQDRTGACESIADGGTRPDDYLRFGEGPVRAPRTVIASGRPLAVADARTSTAIVPGRAEQHGIASALFVPVMLGPPPGEVRNVLLLLWNERREISSDDVDTAQLAADQAAAGLRPPRGRASGAPPAPSRTARSSAPPPR